MASSVRANYFVHNPPPIWWMPFSAMAIKMSAVSCGTEQTEMQSPCAFRRVSRTSCKDLLVEGVEDIVEEKVVGVDGDGGGRGRTAGLVLNTCIALSWSRRRQSTPSIARLLSNIFTFNPVRHHGLRGPWILRG